MLDEKNFTNGYVYALGALIGIDQLPPSWREARGALALVAFFLVLRILWKRL